ncbi:MAG TPA: ATP-binding cassette domain-containing protein [Rhizomicrobium sp.]|jgi:osmoprotectant transport system ATP-binding protein|nr:ATP-binding cassette domain-containing protein [Rhizomicrobium sp.]
MIELDRLSKRFADGPFAVRDVSLSVAQGEFLVLIGESGSGKTTTLNMINRLTEPTSGRILIDGRDIRDADPVTVRRQMGFVFQEVGLFPHMTVEENIAITPRLLGWPQNDIAARVRELLELVKLDGADAAQRFPAQLSGGQRQRAGLARALAAKPRLMLMDEPFGALDALIRDELAADYRAIHDSLGLTTILVTHDMTEAFLLADRIAVMRDGALLQVASPKDLAANPANDFVRAMIDIPRQRAKRLAAAMLSA